RRRPSASGSAFGWKDGRASWPTAQRKPRRPPSAPKRLLQMRESSPRSADRPRTWPPTSSPRSSRTPVRALAGVLAPPRAPQLWMVGERLRIAAAVPGVGEETLDAARLPAVDDRLQLPWRGHPVVVVAERLRRRPGVHDPRAVGRAQRRVDLREHAAVHMGARV